MADKPGKEETIEYSPEELAEIERITQNLPGGSVQEQQAAAETISLNENMEPDFTPDIEQPVVEEDEGPTFEPDLSIQPEETAEPEVSFEPENIELPDIDTEIPETVEPLDDLTDGLPDLDLPGTTEEPGLDFEDITDRIHEVEEPDEGEQIPDEMEGLEDIAAEPVVEEEVSDVLSGLEDISAEEPFEMPELSEIVDSELAPEPEVEQEIPEAEEEPIVEPAAESIAKEKSTMDQLDDLTLDEPDSVDIQDFSEEFLEELQNKPEHVVDETAPSFDLDIPEDLSTGEVEQAISEEGIDEMPDLSDITSEGIEEIPETHSDDVPEINLGDLEDITAGIGDELPTEDIAPELEMPAAFDEVPEEIEPGLSDIGDVEEMPGTAEPSTGDGEPVDLTDKELKQLKKAILLFPPGLMHAVKEAILHDLLSPSDTRNLVDMIIDRRPEENIHRFLEKKLNKQIDLEGAGLSNKRVIYSRKEYTEEGRDRQKRLLKYTRRFGLAAIVACIVTILSYNYIYKPIMAKKKINEGVVLIRKKNDSKLQDYKKAEAIFKDVDENYKKDYMYGYNKYARSYFDMKNYNRSLSKLNYAYDNIDHNDVDLLNTLGYVYTRMPKQYFNSIKSNLNEYYYKKVPPLEKITTQLDVAIDFYRKALNIDAKNDSSLVGIGNAYFYQGQYLKAKQYYENLLKVDNKSIAGHSGLINLYIERDDFPELISEYVSVRDNSLLHKLPAPLLGKLSGYFLSKSRTEDSNVRVDHGIQSTRLKDDADNLFPAVRQVLAAMQSSYPDYPPLYLHYAKFAEKQNNLKLVESNLLSSIERAEKNNQQYFDAYHMMGKLYYKIKEPALSYKYLRKAINARQNPADFTLEDFYTRTQHPGETYAVMGNIFYYFFDKVKSRFGDDESIEEELRENEKETYANFLIAQNKYETAVNEGFESAEVHYNLGRIYYLNGLYEKSLNQWLNLYDDFTTSPDLMFGLGNVFYKLNNLESSKAQFLKLISIYEFKAEKIVNIQTNNDDHIKVFQTLASSYNNLGAVYQLQKNEVKSNISYWKSVDYAKRVNRESEFSRVNLSRAFKTRTHAISPVLDENIPYSVNIYREEMR